MRRLLNFLTGRSHLKHLLRVEDARRAAAEASASYYRSLYIRERDEHRDLQERVIMEGA